MMKLSILGNKRRMTIVGKGNCSIMRRNRYLRRFVLPDYLGPTTTILISFLTLSGVKSEGDSFIVMSIYLMAFRMEML